MSATGGIQVTTAKGVVAVQPGDYILPDGGGGFIVVPAVFYALHAVGYKDVYHDADYWDYHGK